jgi:hypothetical protein
VRIGYQRDGTPGGMRRTGVDGLGTERLLKSRGEPEGRAFRFNSR